jgi:hypothetical protein
MAMTSYSKEHLEYEEFEVLKAEVMNVAIFGDITLCRRRYIPEVGKKLHNLLHKFEGIIKNKVKLSL